MQQLVSYILLAVPDPIEWWTLAVRWLRV